MALVDSAWTINVTVEDLDGNTSTVTGYVGGAAIFVDVETLATGFVNAISAISDGVVKSYSIVRNVIEDAPATPPETSDVERKGFFMWRLSDTRNFSMSVPSIKNSLVLNGSNQINRTDTSVANFILAVDALGVDRVGTDIIRIEKAEKRHRRNTEG